MTAYTQPPLPFEEELVLCPPSSNGAPAAVNGKPARGWVDVPLPFPTLGTVAEILAASAADPTNPVAIDSESNGLEPWRGQRIYDISVGIGERTWHLPLRRRDGGHLEPGAARYLLATLDTRKHIFIWANFKHDAGFLLADLGIDPRVASNHWDVLIGAWLEDENHPARDLKGRHAFLFPDAASRAEQAAMQAACKGMTVADLEDLHYYGPGGREAAGGRRQPMGITRAVAHERALADPRRLARQMWDLSAEEIGPYAARDAALTLDLYRYQRSLAPHHGLAAAMPREMAVAGVLLDMERAGIAVDAAAAESHHAAAVSRLAELADAFPIDNPNSHPQLVKLVFTDWGFPVLERSPQTHEPSTAKAVLELLGDDPRITTLLEWRHLTKMMGTYYRPLLTALDDAGRVHPSFKQNGTKTGRFSCPIFQQIPRQDTDAQVRGLFRPAPGYALVGFDLAQAEVRVAAAISHEEALLAALAAGEDVYATVARAMGVKRHIAKEVVLARNYGASARRLAVSLLKGTGQAVTPTHVHYAEKLQDLLDRRFPALSATARRLEHLARAEGRIPLPPPGRFRHFRGAGHAPEEYKDAFNSACQGGVAELAKSLMVESTRAGLWQDNGARLLLQIHDELVAEVPPERVEWLAGELQTCLRDISWYRTVDFPLEIKVWRAL